MFRFRPCEVALALLCTEFQRQVGDHTTSGATALMGFISELQKYCNISSSEFCSVLGEVVAILDKYNAAGQVPHRQRLVWKLSNRSDSHPARMTNYQDFCSQDSQAIATHRQTETDPAKDLRGNHRGQVWHVETEVSQRV